MAQSDHDGQNLRLRYPDSPTDEHRPALPVPTCPFKGTRGPVTDGEILHPIIFSMHSYRFHGLVLMPILDIQIMASGGWSSREMVDYYDMGRLSVTDNATVTVTKALENNNE